MIQSLVTAAACLVAMIALETSAGEPPGSGDDFRITELRELKY